MANIGSDVISTGTGGASPGDRKWSDLLIDHGDWILLDGRLKSALTAAQQVTANTLGYGVNIPDMRGKFPLGTLAGTYPALTSGGSSTFTIGQTNLPNINLSGGSHGHGITDSGHSHGTGSYFPQYNYQNFIAAAGTGATGSSFTSNSSAGGGSYNGAMGGTSGSSGTGISISSSGSLSIPLGGSGSPISTLNPYGTGNWFVWLGASSPTVTVSQPLSLTTTGSAGTAATFNAGTGVLNVPTSTIPVSLTTTGAPGTAATFNPGTGVLNVPTPAAASAVPVVQTFLANATYIPTAGMKYCIAEMIGAGGAGANPAGAAGSCRVGGAGGAGAYVRVMLTAAQIGVSKAIVIGVGGTALANNGATTAGTDTTLGGTLAVARAGSNSTQIAVSNNNGLPQYAAGSRGGTFAITGGGVDLGSCVGAAGEVSICSSNTAGTIFSYYLGSGGISRMSSQNLPESQSSTQSGVIFVAGISGAANSGNGGSGPALPGGAGSVAPGNGGSGKCIVTEYF